MSTRQERLTFPNHQGHKLSARLELPESEPGAFALFAHGFTCTKDLAAASHISGALSERGIAVLRFDFTGLGNSDGDFANTNFSSNVDDLVAASEFLRDAYQAPRILIGHSLGGAATLAAAGRIPEAVAVVTIGAPSNPEHVSHLFEKEISTIEKEGSATVLIGGRRFQIKRQFLEDISAQRIEEHVRKLGKALLVLHSPNDRVVTIDHARRIFECARHPKSFVSLDHADHLLTQADDSEYVGRLVASWASRYLQARADVVPEF
jgi:putative redox protein